MSPLLRHPLPALPSLVLRNLGPKTPNNPASSYVSQSADSSVVSFVSAPPSGKIQVPGLWLDVHRTIRLSDSIGTVPMTSRHSRPVEGSMWSR